MIALNVVNVVIGLVFTWTIFSMAAMYIQEWIASKRKWRARMLEITIGNILTDPVLLHQLYSHPIIQSLYTGNSGENKPSYIPSVQFAQALLDIISTSGTDASLLQQQLFKIQHEILSHSRKKEHAQQQLGLILAMIRRVLVDKSGSDATNSILSSASNELLALGDDSPGLKPSIDKALNAVVTIKKEIVSHIEASGLWQAIPGDAIGKKIFGGMIALGVTQPRLKQTLDALQMVIPAVAWESEVGLEQLRNNIEEWYTNSMARLTGWYKRRAQISMLMIGLVIAFFFNVDSVMLASRLWSEPYQYDSILAQAENYLDSQSSDPENQNNQESLSSLIKVLNSIQLPIGWLSMPDKWDAPAGQTSTAATCLLSPLHEQDVYGFRIGKYCVQLTNTPLPSDIMGWILKILGLFATAFSISQGAPFWFDILRKLINIRFTGFNPTETAKPVG